MTKQEEIREGIATVIRVNKEKFAKCVDSELEELTAEEIIYWMTDKIRHNLDSQGVVLKVERELPSCAISEVLTGNRLPPGCPFAKAGYVAVEPLVKKE